VLLCHGPRARCLLPFSACSAASRPGVCLVIGSGHGYMCGGGKAKNIGARKQGGGDVPIGEREGRDCNATVSSSRLSSRVCSCGGDGEEVLGFIFTSPGLCTRRIDALFVIAAAS